MKKLFFSTLIAAFILNTFSAHAKIWRINNNAGVLADFSNFDFAANSPNVAAGDTLYFEPSANAYTTGNFSLTKRLVIIGPGYFLDPTNTSTPGNAGLQVSTEESEITFFRIGAAASGSKFMGVTLAGAVYINNANNISFEKVRFPAGVYFESGTNDSFSFRKCFFQNGAAISNSGNAIVSKFVCENNIFYGASQVNLPGLTGSGNILRNNSMLNTYGFILTNTYVANNIFGIGGECNFTNCTIKNNLFQVNQTLPGTATGNQVNVNMANVYIGGTTGSFDSRMRLKAGSPAIAAGLTIGAVVTPDCGAYGATDPYKLSGIPNIPSIYTLTAPISIPSGTATMNVTFSSRNNN
ncbi:MAG: hypothetical protein EOP54_22840 [Sphingobacteriales bacterium]|nr:MAG: hypothetical protein EOP54_22840 [Sphingobacteriales bacterium]